MRVGYSIGYAGWLGTLIIYFCECVDEAHLILFSFILFLSVEVLADRCAQSSAPAALPPAYSRAAQRRMHNRVVQCPAGRESKPERGVLQVPAMSTQVLQAGHPTQVLGSCDVNTSLSTHFHPLLILLHSAE